MTLSTETHDWIQVQEWKVRTNAGNKGDAFEGVWVGPAGANGIRQSDLVDTLICNGSGGAKEEPRNAVGASSLLVGLGSVAMV